MKFTVYKRTIDTKGGETWSKIGESDTWRGTHQYRTLTKESRKNGVSFVYDDTGALRSTP